MAPASPTSAPQTGPGARAAVAGAGGAPTLRERTRARGAAGSAEGGAAGGAADSEAPRGRYVRSFSEYVRSFSVKEAEGSAAGAARENTAAGWAGGGGRLGELQRGGCEDAGVARGPRAARAARGGARVATWGAAACPISTG